MLIRAAHLKFSKDKFLCDFRWREKSFSQRLVATTEGIFTTVCLISRPARRRKPTKCLDISAENSASVWIFGSLLTNSQSRPKSDGTRNFVQGGK